MAGPPLDEKVAAIARALRAGDVPHAFGGALALAYYATPRSTVDIDLNVFLPGKEAERVLGALVGLGVDTGGAAVRERIERDGQARVRWDETPLDLFFAYDPLHASCMERRRRVPFGAGETLEILSPEDLVVFKVIFDRPKDWLDIEEVLFAQAGDLDAGYALDWLGRILEEDDARLARLRAAVSARA